MSLDDGLSTFLGSLYEAVYDPDTWRSGMEEIISRTGCKLAVVSVVDKRRRKVDDLQFHGRESPSTEKGMDEYRNEMFAVDPVLKWIIENPFAALCDSAAVIRSGEYLDQPMVRWSQSRFGTDFWRVFFTPPVDDLQFVLTLQAKGNECLRGREQVRLQALLFENLERAVRLAARPPNFTADDSALMAVDGAGRVLSLSDRAEKILADTSGLFVSGSRLIARQPEADCKLRQAISASVDPGSGELPGRGIRIERGPGKSDLLVVVSHFPSSLNHLPRPVPTALVRLVELDSGPEHLTAHSHLFDLSPREIEVAQALLDGHSLESMAVLLGISRNTVRNHLQALFEKTETNRQSHLIQVLERVSRQ